MRSNHKKVKDMKVVRVTRTEFEMDNGDIYPLPFELDYTPTLKEFNEIYANSKVLVDTLIAQSKARNFPKHEEDTDN